MNNSLKNPEPLQPATEKIATQPQKLPYSSPVLQVYGAVSELTQGASRGSKKDFTARRTSDRRAKENIIKVDHHPLGIGLYLFDYKPEYRAQWGAGRQFGVMADEVETVMPEAVSVHADGYKLVDYAMLGLHQPLQ